MFTSLIVLQMWLHVLYRVYVDVTLDDDSKMFVFSYFVDEIKSVEITIVQNHIHSDTHVRTHNV